MKLRSATLNDIDFIQTQETREEFRTLIKQGSREQHSQNITHPDYRYLIIENEQGERQGYAILSGLTSVNRSICLNRLVIAQPGKGYGKVALRLIIKKVFEEFKAHRFWLDVFEYNHRAKHVYESVGFQTEGLLRDAVKRGNSYHSMFVMSMLEQEYDQKYN